MIMKFKKKKGMNANIKKKKKKDPHAPHKKRKHVMSVC